MAALFEGLGKNEPFRAPRMSRQTDWLADNPAMDVCRWLGSRVAVAVWHCHQTKQETMAAVTGVQEDARDDIIASLRAELNELKKKSENE